MKNEDWIISPEAEFRGYLNEVVKFNEVLGVGDLDEALTKQDDLIEEETKEALAEWGAGNKAGIVKECCDLFIVTGYKGVLQGLTPSLIAYGYARDCAAVVCGILSEWEFRHRFGQAAAHEAMAVLIYLDCDWAGAMKNVLESNMSKLSLYYPHNIGLYEGYSQHLMDTNIGRYEGVTWRKSQCGSLVVWTDSKGKILKGPDYFKADMGKFVNGGNKDEE